MERYVDAKRLLIVFLVIEFSILPEYFNIAGFAAYNVITALILVLWVLLSNGKIALFRYKPGLSFIFTAWVIIRCIVYIYHGDYSRAIVFIIFTFGMAYMIADFTSSKERFLKILDIMLICSGVVAVFGVIESLTRFNIFSILNNTGATMNYVSERFGLVRIISFTYQAIAYALYCAIMACLAFYRITIACEQESKKFKIIYFLLALNVVLTLSRSIIILFLLSQALILLKMGLKRLLKTLIVVGVIAAAGSMLWSLFVDGDNLFLQFFYMLMAVFDDSYASKISSSFGEGDASGVGDRLILYTWVYNSVKDNMLFGLGENASFSYEHKVTNRIYTWTNVKQSIEVNFLYLLYHYGIFAMISEAAAYISTCISSFRTSFIKRYSWESDKINFNFICFVIFLMDILSWFVTMRGSETHTLYLVWFLAFAYNVNDLEDSELKEVAE